MIFFLFHINYTSDMNILLDSFIFIFNFILFLSQASYNSRRSAASHSECTCDVPQYNIFEFFKKYFYSSTHVVYLTWNKTASLFKTLCAPRNLHKLKNMCDISFEITLFNTILFVSQPYVKFDTVKCVKLANIYLWKFVKAFPRTN